MWSELLTISAPRLVARAAHALRTSPARVRVWHRRAADLAVHQALEHATGREQLTTVRMLVTRNLRRSIHIAATHGVTLRDCPLRHLHFTHCLSLHIAY